MTLKENRLSSITRGPVLFHQVSREVNANDMIP